MLCNPERRLPLATRILSLTGSLGVRALEWDRLLLPRELRRVQTPLGRVRIKVATTPEGLQQLSAEYDDCKRIARRRGLPIAEVVRQVEEAARRVLLEDPG